MGIVRLGTGVFAAFTLVTAGLVGAPSAFAAEAASRPQVQLDIDLPSSGPLTAQTFQLTAQRQLVMQGKWGFPGQAGSTPQLVYKVGARYPTTLNLLGPNGLPVASTPASDPKQKEATLQLPLLASKDRSGIKAVLPDGKTLEFTLRTSLTTSGPLVIKNPSCQRLGLNADVKVSKGAAPVVFVNCAEASGGQVIVAATALKGVAWAAPAPTQKDIKVLDGGQTLLRQAPGSQAEGTAFMSSPLRDPTGAQEATLIVTSTKASGGGEASRSRFSLIASLGPTYAQYAEPANSLSLTQVGITGKAQLGFQIIPRRFDLAASVFGTIYPFVVSVSPADRPGARWLGVNFRFGVLFPIGSVDTIALLPGYYAWSMFVSPSLYGIQNLNGPQLVISYRHIRSSGAAHGLYVKAALMAIGFSISGVSNRELAAGFYTDVKIFGPTAKPLNLAFDFSLLNFALGVDSLSLMTGSFSIGYAIF